MGAGRWVSGASLWGQLLHMFTACTTTAAWQNEQCQPASHESNPTTTHQALQARHAADGGGQRHLALADHQHLQRAQRAQRRLQHLCILAAAKLLLQRGERAGGIMRCVAGWAAPRQTALRHRRACSAVYPRRRRHPRGQQRSGNCSRQMAARGKPHLQVASHVQDAQLPQRRQLGGHLRAARRGRRIAPSTPPHARCNTHAAPQLLRLASQRAAACTTPPASTRCQAPPAQLPPHPPHTPATCGSWPV